MKLKGTKYGRIWLGQDPIRLICLKEYVASGKKTEETHPVSIQSALMNNLQKLLKFKKQTERQLALNNETEDICFMTINMEQTIKSIHYYAKIMKIKFWLSGISIHTHRNSIGHAKEINTI